MTVTSAYAAYATSYTNRTPYLSLGEYNNAPTAMDVSNLIAGGNPDAQSSVLAETISRASSWIDQITMGSWGTLAATVNVENARIWGNNAGQLIVHPKYWPLLEVDSFSYAAQGFANNTAASITPAGNIWIEPMQFIVQPQGVMSWGLNGGGGGIAGGRQYFCTWSYCNGYPVSTLSASVGPGATSIAPVSVTGIYPGTELTIYDDPFDETVQVAASYVPGTATVPLTPASTLVNDHMAGVMVTNLPPAVKQAAILLTTALIKQRGSGALIVNDIGEVSHTQSSAAQDQAEDVGRAFELLQPFKAIFVG